MRWAWLFVLTACRIGFDELAVSDATRDSAVDARVPACAIELQLHHDTTCARVGSDVRCWGRTAEGQLGTGVTVGDHVPKAIASGFGERVFMPGGRFSCGIDDAGAVRCVGWARDGQLGDNSTADRTTLGPVSLPMPAVAIVSGARHMCVQLADESMWCWGCLVYDPNSTSSTNRCTTAQNTPMQFATRGEPLEAHQHICYLDGGLVRCRGENSDGQLGDGTKTAAGSFVDTQIDRVVAYGAGRSHACALRDDGSVWCWGQNGGGQLGDGTTTEHLLPAPVPDLGGIVDLAVGGYHTCARKADGVILCWGSNGEGQIGTANANELVPVVYPAPPAIDVDAGSLATCIADYDGMVWCSGQNAFGRTGIDGTLTMNVRTPTAGLYSCP